MVVDDQAGHRTILLNEPVIGGGVTMARGGTENADRRLGIAAWQQIETLIEDQVS